MITEALIEGVAAFVAWVIDLMPTFTVPDWWTTVVTWTDGLEAIGHFGNVIPLPAIAASAVALLAATVTATVISTSRTVFSMTTGGGGAK